ncbi:MAG: ATP-dependent nuclease, partial [Candidatus Sericytochromatia bacterium]
DYKNNISQSNHYRLNGISELLNFKIFETKRYLDFILNNYEKTDLIFKNRINKIRFKINSFYDIYWESIDDYFKTSDENIGAIKKVTSFIEERSKSNNYGYTDLKSNLYRQFIYCALKFEYDYRWGIKNKEGSNALIDTLNLFVDSTKGKRTPHTILEAFLSKTLFNKKSKINIKLFASVINYITDNAKIKYLYEDSFDIDISEIETINELFRLFYENENFNTNNKYYLCNFLLIEFQGLSNGEKNLLSLFSRLYSSSKYYDLKNKEIIMLLDEPEVGLHPQWQTEFITKLLSFINILFSDNKTQILLTTHSPILLSDFPPNHILYLKKNEENGECVIDNEQNEFKSFGANIHSLYANSFFLKDNKAALGSIA